MSHPTSLFQRALGNLQSKKHMVVTIVVSGFCLPINAMAEEVVDFEPSSMEVATAISEQKQKVYVENGSGSHRATRSDEFCFFHEAHDHIHCYDEDPNTIAAEDHRNNSTVFVEETRTYRSTRDRTHRSSPIATGIGVGLAIGIPLLVHDGLRDHRRYARSNRHYNRHYNNNYRYTSHNRNHRYGTYYRSHRDSYKRYNKHKRKYRAYLY